MKKAHAWRRTLISVILTILGVYLFIPLYSNGNLNYFQSRFNKKALVVVSSDVAISPEKSVCVWGGIDELRCNKASCRLLVRDLSYDWRKKKVSFKPDSDAKISISFGISESKPQTMVDYTDIEINGNKVSKNIARVSKGKPYEKKIEISAGEKLTITFKVRRHHFRLKNLSDLYGFNGYLFISILILTFLGAYKLVNYVAKFKLLENNSRIDIVFVIVFAVLLFIPMSRISTAEKSMQENRMLAKYKPLLTTKGLNLQYGTDFEKWFNDRFFGRKEMLQLYSAVKLYTNNIYENGNAFLIKQSNWMFRIDYMNHSKSSDNGTREIIKQVALLNDFCKKYNIRAYMLIVPSKESVYSEYLPISYQMLLEKKGLNNYLQKLVDKFEIPTIFPYDKLRKASNYDFVFFKQSHHWTDWGAYVGYKALMELIKKDYPDIHITQPSEYNIFTSKFIREDWGMRYGTGATTKTLYIGKKYAADKLLKNDYVYYDYRDIIAPEITDIDYYKIKYFVNKQRKTAPKVFLTGTSMSENLLQFLPYSFSEVNFYRLNGNKKVASGNTFKLLRRYKKDILDYNPDILIMCFNFNNVRDLLNLTKD